jgi:hypothetical protein
LVSVEGLAYLLDDLAARHADDEARRVDQAAADKLFS